MGAKDAWISTITVLVHIDSKPDGVTANELSKTFRGSLRHLSWASSYMHRLYKRGLLDRENRLLPKNPVGGRTHSFAYTTTKQAKQQILEHTDETTFLRQRIRDLEANLRDAQDRITNLEQS